MMIEGHSYVVRPHPSSSKGEMKEIFWVYLSAANLLMHDLKSGDACQFQTSQGVMCPAIVFEGTNIKDTVIQTSKTFQGLYSIQLGHKITLKSLRNRIQDARTIVLSDESMREEGQQPLTEVRSSFIFLQLCLLPRNWGFVGTHWIPKLFHLREESETLI